MRPGQHRRRSTPPSRPPRSRPRPPPTPPASQVATNGVLTLPALTFTKAGTYPVKLTLSNGSTRYVKVKVNQG
jgi:hypothetical protein